MTPDPISSSLEAARRALRDVFGYDSFRCPQQDVIASILEGRDAFALMPTGGGKSLCFQIPSIVLDGTGLVVSPLIALMDDQVATLRQAGVRAGALHSGIPFEEILRTERAFENALAAAAPAPTTTRSTA